MNNQPGAEATRKLWNETLRVHRIRRQRPWDPEVKRSHEKLVACCRQYLVIEDQTKARRAL